MIASTQYLLPDGLDAAELSRALAPTLALRADSRVAGERTFYDTFDGRLHRAGLSLVHEAGRLALLEGGHGERAGAHQPRPPKRLLAADLPTGRLRGLLLPLVERRALTRLVLVQSRRRPLRVLDDEDKTVVRLVLEEPRVWGMARVRSGRVCTRSACAATTRRWRGSADARDGARAGRCRRVAAGRGCRTGGRQPRRRLVQASA